MKYKKYQFILILTILIFFQVLGLQIPEYKVYDNNQQVQIEQTVSKYKNLVSYIKNIYLKKKDLKYKMEQKRNYQKLKSKKKKKKITKSIYDQVKSKTKLDCENIKNMKKAILISQSQPKLIIEYFKSRCDFKFVQNPVEDLNNFDFKWTSLKKYQNFTEFIPGKQIINHIDGIKDAISDKDDLTVTLRNFDKKKLYNFNSTDFQFRSFNINLKSQTYSKSERQFLKLKKGIWMTKDPIGAQGIGIKMHKDIKKLQKTVKQLKANYSTMSEKEIKQNSQYSFVQEYLSNPLLKDGKKVDFRTFVLVASLDPFVVLYQDGFVKQCVEKYDTNVGNFNKQEAFKHISNISYQKYHPDYEKNKDELCMTPQIFEQYLRKEYNFGDEEIEQMQKKQQKLIAYTLMAGKPSYKIQKGAFQILGLDIIWDDEFNVKLIEINTNISLSLSLNCMQKTNPQLIQTTYDLMLETFSDISKLKEKWSQPEKLDLGRWRIIINEANNYNVLDEFLIEKKQ
ncbi:hypothetical protein PPERSA_04031 [Pseudocohnilembus persalinus]|uniref:Tubulin-tyrosine ligase/Tubulin polyglutamylase n=1 Tax=Pseudocohnilembus persalinus TaxID=266149 RepID=A0A0V0QL38_PSEPJ|nr:hypothetical protein PPERSA_04031 [Pseudocohnilembus persalinus]|eukprot:KRX02828.1 hypothetical protein PPERSA_04031 [Pseudocohnilembus persalinus]